MQGKRILYYKIIFNMQMFSYLLAVSTFGGWYSDTVYITLLSKGSYLVINHNVVLFPGARFVESRHAENKKI